MILTTSAAAGQYSKVFSADLHLYLAQDSHTSMIADTQVEKLHNKGKKYLKSIQEVYKKSRLVNNLMWGPAKSKDWNFLWKWNINEVPKGLKNP